MEPYFLLNARHGISHEGQMMTRACEIAKTRTRKTTTRQDDAHDDTKVRDGCTSGMTDGDDEGMRVACQTQSLRDISKGNRK